jgi:hypothetical protein
MGAHYFLIDDLGSFLDNLEARRYSRRKSNAWMVYSKTVSGALTKHYAYFLSKPNPPIQIRVTYDLIKEGKPLQKLVDALKRLNDNYRKALPMWKTKRPRSDVRERRLAALRRFLRLHGELIDCFRYEADDRLTEGNLSFNLQIASTPKEQRICLELIKALAEAYAPNSIVRRRRQADKPIQQRNGWIKRYADLHKRRGWRPFEITREIQKELRGGTWNERSRLQFNLANNTICKIAGFKLTPTVSAWN